MDLDLNLPRDGEFYGIPFLKKAPNQLIREFSAYLMTRGKFGRELRGRLGVSLTNCGLKSAFQHCVNISQLLWPKEVELEVRGYRNHNTLRVYESLCEEDDLGISGNASSSKTHPVAAFAVLDWMAFPAGTSTFLATTSLEASEDRLWGRAAYLYRSALKSMEQRYGPACTIGHLIDYRKMIVYEEINTKDEAREYSNAIKAVAFPQGEEGKKAIAVMRGRKNQRVRLFIDEFAEMDIHVLDVRVNLKSNPDFMFGAAANPDNRPGNPHRELCEPDDLRGWESVNKNMDEWYTRTGKCIFLSGERSPNFQAPENESPPFPYLLTRDREQEILKLCYGNKNSLQYWRNVIGFWPGTEVDLTIFTKTFLSSLGLNYEPIWTSDKRPCAALDCAFGPGGDKNSCSFGITGIADDGKLVGHYITTKNYYPLVNEVYEQSIARQVVADCIGAGVSPRDFGMDVSGDGGKMMQAIMQEWAKVDPTALEIYPISSMGTPSENVVSKEDRRTCKEAYDRKVTEYWFWAYNAMGAKAVTGLDLRLHSNVVNDLVVRQYFHKGKKVAVETKREMKERIRRSPDDGDSFIYLLQIMRRAGVEIGETPEVKEELSEELEEYLDSFSEGNRPKKEGEEGEMYSYAGTQSDGDGF